MAGDLRFKSFQSRALDPMDAHLRIARPVSSLALSVAMYRRGLGLQEIGRFENHDGFDGVMLGHPGLGYHFEFTYCRAHPITPAPTPEDLIVFYLSEPDVWQETCLRVLDAGFAEARPFNPYWQQCGRTFEDHDHYRLVLQRASWRSDEGS
jgi:catechol 2,3-dioxygenase-like lactoylglutathione lyase family enzyme